VEGRNCLYFLCSSKANKESGALVMGPRGTTQRIIKVRDGLVISVKDVCFYGSTRNVLMCCKTLLEMIDGCVCGWRVCRCSYYLRNVLLEYPSEVTSLHQVRIA